jgi:hypothetical protein
MVILYICDFTGVEDHRRRGAGAGERCGRGGGGGGAVSSHSLTPAMRTLRAGVPTEYADQRHTGLRSDSSTDPARRQARSLTVNAKCTVSPYKHSVRTVRYVHLTGGRLPYEHAPQQMYSIAIQTQ